MTYKHYNLGFLLKLVLPKGPFVVPKGMLLEMQFEHFITEVAAESSLATADVHVSSPPYDVHLEEMDLSYPGDVAGNSQDGPSQPSQYQFPPLPERHVNASYYLRRRRRPTQLDRVEEGDKR